MRKRISISVSEAMYEHIMKQAGFGSVSEYVRSPIRREQERREDQAARPVALPKPANEKFAVAEALDQLDRLRAILEGGSSH